MLLQKCYMAKKNNREQTYNRDSEPSWKALLLLPAVSREENLGYCLDNSKSRNAIPFVCLYSASSSFYFPLLTQQSTLLIKPDFPFLDVGPGMI